MDILPLARDLGFPIALVVYLLWQERRFLDQAKKEYDSVVKRINELQCDRLTEERRQADQYRALAARILMVVDKNNTALERIKLYLDLKEQEEETRIIKAFEPADVTTPPIENRACTSEEVHRLQQAKDHIRHRSPRPL